MIPGAPPGRSSIQLQALSSGKSTSVVSELLEDALRRQSLVEGLAGRAERVDEHRRRLVRRRRTGNMDQRAVRFGRLLEGAAFADVARDVGQRRDVEDGRRNRGEAKRHQPPAREHRALRR